MGLAANGRIVYYKACAICHEVGGDRFGEVISYNEVKTDPGRALGRPPISATALAELMLEACKAGAPYSATCNLPVDEVLNSRFGEEGYVTGPLDGIWARAPYLHNGSVPTMEHLLVPDSRPVKYKRGSLDYDTERLGFDWNTGTHEFDTQKNGLRKAGHDDAEIFFGGYDFKKDTASRTALIEYLKTL